MNKRSYFTSGLFAFALLSFSFVCAITINGCNDVFREVRVSVGDSKQNIKEREFCKKYRDIVISKLESDGFYECEPIPIFCGRALNACGRDSVDEKKCLDTTKYIVEESKEACKEKAQRQKSLNSAIDRLPSLKSKLDAGL
jgi:hypothetical protein